MEDKQTAGAHNFKRRTWDKEKYAKLAEEKLYADAEFEKKQEEQAKKPEPIVPGPEGLARVPGSQRAFLQTPTEKVDLESNVGKRKVVTDSTPKSESGGYYCEVCDCVLRDSMAWLDHRAGKKHQRKMGFSMRVERSSVDQVRARFAALKRKAREPEPKRQEYDLESRMQAAEEAERQAREQRLEAKRQRREQQAKEQAAQESAAAPAAQELTADEAAMQAMMGIGGFGGSKKQ